MPDTFPAPAPARAWLRALLSGPDNATPAIGRVMAFAVVLIVLGLLVVALPAAVAASYWLQRVKPDQWLPLIAALQGYVPAVLVSTATFATALIALTNQTEPRQTEPAQPKDLDHG